MVKQTILVLLGVLTLTTLTIQPGYAAEESRSEQTSSPTIPGQVSASQGSADATTGANTVPQDQWQTQAPRQRWWQWRKGNRPNGEQKPAPIYAKPAWPSYIPQGQMYQ